MAEAQQWTPIVTSPQEASDREQRRPRTLTDVMRESLEPNSAEPRAPARSDSIDSGLRKRLEVVASEALHPKMQELLARYEDTHNTAPSPTERLAVSPTERLAVSPVRRPSVKSSGSGASSNCSSREESNLFEAQDGSRLKVPFPLTMPEACDNISENGSCHPSQAGSTGNSRRPSRIIDADELKQAVNVHLDLQAVVKNEEKRSQHEVAHREYSDQLSPKVKKRMLPAFAFSATGSSLRESLDRVTKTVQMGRHATMAIWALAVAISICISLQVAGLLMLSNSLQIWRLRVVERIISEHRSHPLAFFFLMTYAMVAALVSSIFVVFLAPRAGGSGVPDLKAFLNGNSIPMLFSFRTWLSRGLGLVLVTSAGLFAGTEGPCGHLGAITSLGVAECIYGVFGAYLPQLGHHSSCEFVAQGTATGVAAAFGAPVGGILFSLEEASSFWSKSLTWRSFVSSMIAAAIAKAAKTGFTDLPLGGFIDFPDLMVGYEMWELAPFMGIAVCTSLLGAFFCWCVERVTLLRSRLFMPRGLRRRRALQIVEVLTVTLLSISVCFWVPSILGCRSLDSSHTGTPPTNANMADRDSYYVGKHGRTVCQDGHYSDIGTLLLQPKETAIKHLFTQSFDGGAEFATGRLFLCSGLIFVLTLITYGTALPTGLFIPNILIGACFGRGVGQIIIHAFDVSVHPGVHALLGAAGMLAGIGRMSVSLTMIILEITNSMRLLLPVLLCILVSKAIADRCTDSVYDISIALHPLKDISVLKGDLDEEDMPLLRYLTVHDACSVEVHTLKCQELPSHIMSTLMQTKFSGFPLVSTPEHEVVGLILRERLVEALKDSDDNAVDLLPYADEAPEVKHWNTPLAKAHRHFTAAGLRHLCVVDEEHRLVGIMTRSDLAPMSHPKTRREAVHLLLQRKESALSEANMGLPELSDSETSDLTSVISTPVSTPRGKGPKW